MTFRVVNLPRAEADIERNAEWWAENRSLEQAIEWTMTIQVKIETLSEMPQRCRLAPESDRFDVDIHQLFVGVAGHLTHRVLFTIREDTVFVLTVRSVRQNQLQPEDVELP